MLLWSARGRFASLYSKSRLCKVQLGAYDTLSVNNYLDEPGSGHSMMLFIKRHIPLIHHITHFNAFKVEQIAVHQMRGLDVLHGGKDGLSATRI